MRKLSVMSLLFLAVTAITLAQGKKEYDIFFYSPPPGFKLENNKDYLFYSKTDPKDYCQLFLYPAREGSSDVELDFLENWKTFARNPSQGVGDPLTTDSDTVNGWHIMFGAANGSYANTGFVIAVTTFTKGRTTFYAASVFTNEKYLQTARDFINSIEPKPAGETVNEAAVLPEKKEANFIPSGNRKMMAKYNTAFDDGWHAKVKENYVELKKEGTEVRLHYPDKELDDARPNTVDAPEYYWSRYVEPWFTVGNPAKWSGVQYPVIYFMEGNAIEKATGKNCYVAIKIVYYGGARPVVIVAPDQESYNRQFPHPNDADRMLNYNKFGVTAADIVGTWNGSGGGGVEYYNAYTGTYAGMSAVSTTDEFTFNSDGTYSSRYRSASTNNYGTQFGGQDFNGKYSVTDWTITATNRYGGKTTTYNAQLIAVKNGYLLFMSDSDNPSMQYTLFRSK